MDTSSEIKSKYFAMLVTIGFHAILFLLFLLVVFISPEKSAMASNSRGTTSFIGLDVSNVPVFEDEKVVEKKSSKSEISSYLTDPNEIVLYEKKQINSAKKNFESKSLQEQPEEALQMALKNFGKFKTAKKSEDFGVGELEKKGNIEKGRNTIPETISSEVSLNGRTLIKKPEASTDSEEDGVVLVEIVVDEMGNVIRAIPGQRGSTLTSKSLFEKAKQKAFQAKFNSSPNGIREQRGTYKFVFTLQ